MHDHVRRRYAGTADMLWLSVIAKPLYQPGIGQLMAEKPCVALLFYLLYALGVVMFAVSPQHNGSSWAWTPLFVLRIRHL